MLNPVLDSGIRPEQPIERPSGFAALAGLGGIFVNAIGSRPEPRQLTQSERDNLALQPFAQRIGDLANAVPSGNRGGIVNQVRAEYTQFVRQNPALAPEAKGIMESVLGITTTPMEASPVDAFISGLNSWMETPEGRTAYMASVVTDASGQVDAEQTALNLNVAFQRDQSEQAQLTRTKRQMEQAQSDVNLWKAQSESALADYLPAWQQDSQKFVDNVVKMAAAGDSRVDSWDEAMTFLREQERVTRDSYRARALAAGIHPEVFEAQIGQAIAPIQNLIATMESYAKDQDTFLSAMKNGAERGSIEALIEVMGPIAGLPAFREEAGRLLASNKFFTQAEWTNVVEYFKTVQGSGAVMQTLDMFPGLQSTVQESATAEQISNPEFVAELRAKGQDSVIETVRGAGTALSSMPIENLGTTQGQEAILGHIGMVVNGADALDHPLSADELRKVFTPQSIRIISSVAASSAQGGQDVKNSVTSLLSTQMRRNQAELDSIAAGMPELQLTRLSNGQLQIDFDFSTEDGQRFEEYLSTLGINPQNQPEVIRAMSNFSRSWGKKIADASDNVAAYNYLTQTSTRMVPELQQVMQPTAAALQPGMQPMLRILDRTEGGGNYDTLFGHSQREGGVFAGTKITEMTLGELRQFANVSGAYGQWVKGQIGRVATPMGRYQFVGTTLFSLADKLGIPDTAVFTPALQDAIFVYHARSTLSRKSTVAAKRSAMRAEWEGFKYVSDAELDAAIASFETGEPLDFSEVLTTSRASGPMTQALPAAEPFEVPEVPDTQATVASTSVTAPAADQSLGTTRDLDLTEEQRVLAQYLTTVLKGQLTAEGQRILENLGIGPQ